MRAAPLFFLFVLFLLAVPTSTFAQRPAEDWNRLLERREGWLGADGIYMIDLNLDVKANLPTDESTPRTLLVFSDTISGETKEDGKEYGRIAMTNHSFGLLTATEPQENAITFVWGKQEDAKTPDERPRNIVEGRYWLQDGVRYGDRVWLTAILVGAGWKPERIDALSFPIDPTTTTPDFSRPCLDAKAPLSYRTDDAQVVMGAAICDDANDGFLYVFGYVDRFRESSRKDAVVARVPRDRLEDYDEWRFYDGTGWKEGIETLLEKDAVVARGVSAEYSVSRIAHGGASGKWLMVYTPGTISEKVAFRIGETPFGSFGKERVFWRSTIPREMKRVRCYNAKAHPVVSDEQGILVSFNVNRLGDIAKRPAEYRPRFIWLDWQTVEKAAREDASKETTKP